MKAFAKVLLVTCLGLGLMAVGYFQGYLHGVSGVVTDHLKGMKGAGWLGSFDHLSSLNAHMETLRGTIMRHMGLLNVTVTEKPFGMHVRRGSLVVEEVFPGFPAEKLGIHSGCTIVSIADAFVKQGTWMDTFQKMPTPFNVSFFCNEGGRIGHGPVSADKHNFRTMVVKKPYGMNVQVNVVPRVIEVLPGSPAEAAGVKRGFVLKQVSDVPVDAKTWFDAWQKVKLPSTLTFDTGVPVHKNNPFFDEATGAWKTNLSAAVTSVPEDWEEDAPVPGFQDVWATVEELPYGLQIKAAPGKLPVVKSVSPGLPADKSGVKAGDVLVKVAGHRVYSSTWFALFQHASPPFGLRFRRPEVTVLNKDGSLALPAALVAEGPVKVIVTERPFGMHVTKGSDIVQEVFPGLPAYKLGIRKGCAIRKIAGKEVSQGTWMEVFAKETLPFALKLHCPHKAFLAKKGPESGQGPLSAAEKNFKVRVSQRPFGMNIQAHVLPRVVEVLPGSPAEKAGVKASFVLTEIDDNPVDAKNWFDVWQKSVVGAVLTFDTTVPLHDKNPFVKSEGASVQAPEAPSLDGDGALVVPPELDAGFHDFRCAVKKLPFGMHVSAPKDGRPTVHNVVTGSPAEVAGVKVGDTLIGISGLPVDTESWFAAFQQAVPPFGLRFRRSVHASVPNPKPFHRGKNTPAPPNATAPAQSPN